MSNGAREAITEAVDRLKDEAVSLLAEMVRINSENPPGNRPELASFLARELRRWGMTTEIVEPPQALLEKLGLSGPRPSLLARLKPSGSPILAFVSHLDTVPIGDRGAWNVDPLSAQMIDGRMYGRGAMDSKGRIAAYALAVRAIREAGCELAGNLVLAAAADEEIGGEAGAGYLVREGILKADYCIAEGMCDSVCHASNGVIQLELSSRGKACHAANPGQGVNAIYAMVPLLSALEKYAHVLSTKACTTAGIQHPTCSVGTIQGGSQTNVVPDRCAITIDRRVVPDEKIDDVRKELLELIETTAPGTCTTEILVAESYSTDPASMLVQALARNARETMGGEIPLSGMVGFGDARFFANQLRIPTANFGPGRPAEGNGHGPNENVRIDDIVAVAKVCALTAFDLCRRNSPPH